MRPFHQHHSITKSSLALQQERGRCKPASALVHLHCKQTAVANRTETSLSSGLPSPMLFHMICSLIPHIFYSDALTELQSHIRNIATERHPSC